MRIPVSLPLRWLGSAAASVDRAVVQAANWNTYRSAPRIGKLTHAERMEGLADVTATYDEPRYLSSPDTFFVPPPPIQPRFVRVRSLGGGGAVLDAVWASGHPLLLPHLAETYGSHANNHTAHARLFLGGPGRRGPRPAVVAIHGYMGGQYAFEERAFPVRWMLQKGFDVALVVLPFHALRARSGPPLFPGADPRFTIEGCRQAVHDIRGLINHLRARGAPSVGVMGMSLGGYMTALLATLDRDLSFAVPMIPLASFADFARDHGRFGHGTAEGDDQYRAYVGAMDVVSPLARPNLLAGPPNRVLILAAADDHITPKKHAERLAAHFGSPLRVMPGGHLLQLWRGEGFRAIARFWDELGVLEAPPSHRVA